MTAASSKQSGSRRGSGNKSAPAKPRATSRKTPAKTRAGTKPATKGKAPAKTGPAQAARKPASTTRGKGGTKRKTPAEPRTAQRRPAATKTTRPSPTHQFTGWRKWLRHTINWGGSALVMVTILFSGMVIYYAHDMPDIETAIQATRRPAITIQDEGGRMVTVHGDDYGRPRRLDEISPWVVKAILATEDRRFRDHWGVDLIGLTRAMLSNLRAGRMRQGGSTITQQLARNLFLSHDRTLRRKVRELLYTLWLENKFTKDQILTLYLNRIYLGAGTYGVEAAAQRYFGKPAKSLTVYESALLAGLPKAPSKYTPSNDPRLADKRAREVLGNLVETEQLTETQAAAIDGLETARRAERRTRLGGYFGSWVEERAEGYLGIIDRDIVIRTSLDRALQIRVEDLAARVLEGPAAKARVGQLAVLVIDMDGAVKAMVGGRGGGRGQFNRATQARRQPGSAFKPVVFLAGLEAGMTPDTVIADKPITIGDWTPNNYDGQYRGPMRLDDALALSVNTVAARVIQKVGPARVIKLARRLGIKADFDPQPSLALGSAEMSMLEMTAAYAAFANGGRGVWPHAITAISDRKGRSIYARKGGGPGQVINPDDARTLTRMLARVVTQGTGQAADPGFPVAGKTGTSQDFKDAWFVGYSDRYVVGVWMGNDDGTPMNKVTGGGLPAKLWREVIRAAHGI